MIAPPPCAFVSDGTPGQGDYHSANRVKFWHGSATPVVVCGYHAARPEIMRHVFAAVTR